MRAISSTLVVVISFCCFTHCLLADDQASGVTPSRYPIKALTCPDSLLRGCCGVYCPKPTPCVSGFCRGCGPDAYCRKPCPCIPCFRGGCGVTYCPKPCPDLCRPLAADFFICAPRSNGCAGQGACASKASPFTAKPADADSPSKGTQAPSVPPQPPLLH